MITIDAIKINIRDFRDKLVRRTLTMGMIVKALDNIEKNFDEYVHNANKFYSEQIESKEQEIKINDLEYLNNKKITNNQLLIDALEEQDKEIKELKEIIDAQQKEIEVINKYRAPNIFNEDRIWVEFKKG